MADGSTKPISEIKAGDKVRATDPTTGKTAERTVEAVHVDRDKAFTDLTVKVKGRKTVVHTTQQHPFWDKTKKTWVGAGDLTPADELAAGGESATVVAVVNFAAARNMYDLTVSRVHTFYVLAGAVPVLVHNCGVDGGKYGQVQPAGAGNEINHMPQNASTPLSKYSGPAIRMLRGDHRQPYSTGSSLPSQAWLDMQRGLVDSGQIDRAMMNDINDVTSRFPGEYNNRIGEMIGLLADNERYQALRTVPTQVHVQMTLW